MPDHEPSTTEKINKGKWLAGAALILLIAIIVGGIVWRGTISGSSTDDSSIPLVEKQPSRLSVKLVTAINSPIQAWVFAEGTARSSQREYLTFEATGRVTMVGPEKPGTAVKKGDVLATLDKRTFAADVDAALASIEEAKTQVEASTVMPSKPELPQR